jgi:hypothetical protein
LPFDLSCRVFFSFLANMAISRRPIVNPVADRTENVVFRLLL